MYIMHTIVDSNSSNVRIDFVEWWEMCGLNRWSVDVCKNEKYLLRWQVRDILLEVFIAGVVGIEGYHIGEGL